MSYSSFTGRIWSWLVARRWRLIALILLAGNIIFVAKAYKSFRHEIGSIHAENNKIQSNIKEIQTRFAELSGIPFSYAETPVGLKLVPANQGVTKDDLKFISDYRGPLELEGKKATNFSRGKLIASLKNGIQHEFSKDKNNLIQTRTEREALIAFAMLRVHGSMPVYEVRNAVPNDLNQIVQGHSGNCSDYTIRLMMVLESLGVKVSTISSVTPNLGGHVFVDAYDPQEDTSYLLDSNFSVMIAMPKSNGNSFIQSLLSMSDEARVEFAKSVKLTAFPVYFRFVDPGVTGFKHTPLTPEFINESRANREVMWRKWMSQDMSHLIAWWKKAPNHAPRTLREFSSFLNAIPSDFNFSSNYAEKLRTSTGIIISNSSLAHSN